MPRKKVSKRRSRIALGRGVKAAIAVTIFSVIGLLIFQVLQPCTFTLPPQVPFQSQSWMKYADSQVVRIRLINASQLNALPEKRGTLFGDNLLSLKRPLFNLSISKAAYFLDFTFPLLGDKVQVVNVIGLTATGYNETSRTLEAALSFVVENRTGMLIYAAVPGEEQSTGAQGGAAYLALNGHDILYAEGGQIALEKLKRMLDTYRLGSAFLFEAVTIREAYYIATRDLGSPMGLSISIFEEKAEGVRYAVRTAAVRGDVVSHQVLVFDSLRELERNFEGAKSFFFTRTEQACKGGTYVLGTVHEPLDDLRRVLLSL